jgi:hypothetical protein
LYLESVDHYIVLGVQRIYYLDKGAPEIQKTSRGSSIGRNYLNSVGKVLFGGVVTVGVSLLQVVPIRTVESILTKFV